MFFKQIWTRKSTNFNFLGFQYYKCFLNEYKELNLDLYINKPFQYYKCFLNMLYTSQKLVSIEHRLSILQVFFKHMKDRYNVSYFIITFQYYKCFLNIHYVMRSSHTFPKLSILQVFFKRLLRCMLQDL